MAYCFRRRTADVNSAAKIKANGGLWMDKDEAIGKFRPALDKLWPQPTRRPMADCDEARG